MAGRDGQIARRTLAALAVALALAAVPARAAAPAPSAYGTVAMGANGVPGGTVAERTAAYRRLARAGVSAVRMDINWTAVEPAGPPLRDYDFRERDREVRAARRAGLKVIAILAYGHPDYSTLGAAAPLDGGLPPFGLAAPRAFPPDDPADFARYARDTARHYARRFPGTVIGWEVWNEENQGWRFWAPREDPGAYARLLCATYPQLKRVTPRLPVVFGGLFFPAVAVAPGLSGPDFLEAAYDARPRLGRCFDALAYHPYAYPFTAPELDVPVRGSVLSAAGAMRRVLRRNGNRRKPLWITEVGWPTHDRAYGVPEAKQAQYVARMQAASFAQRIPVVGWYTYGDEHDASGGFNQEAWFGFFRRDGSPKPAVRALRHFARTFRRMRFHRDRSLALGLPRGRLLTGGRGFALEFRRRGLAATALWLAGETVADGQNARTRGDASLPRRAVRVPVRGCCAWVSDHLGRTWRRLRARRGAVTLTIGPAPLYLRDGLPRRRPR